MKITAVALNNRKKTFEVRTASRRLPFPYAKLEVKPSVRDPIVRLYVDPEFGREAFTYVLKSGKEGTVHIDYVLDYNRDPAYVRDMLLHKLTLEAQARLASSSLSKRELVRRLGTSATQFYRLLDQTNYRKSIDEMLRLLAVLECDVDITVRARSA